MNTPRATAAVLATLLALVLAGCGASRGGADEPGVKLPPSAAPGPAGASERTSIATASQQTIAASLRANNVSNPEGWAQVVLQYRPYPANDPSLGKLRQALVQYKADPATIDKITNALKP